MLSTKFSKWCYLLVIASATCIESATLKSVHSWKAFDFAFDDHFTREDAIRTGKFVPGSGVPVDVDVYYGYHGPKVFITIPRFGEGIPATLGYVTDAVSKEGNPLIAPFPSWEWNNSSNCDSLISVFRVEVDECGRIWVLDTGKIGPKKRCQPQILSFSLKTGSLLSRYRYPDNVLVDTSLLITPIVDVRNKCRNTFVYAADVVGNAIVVYDHQIRHSWRIENELFKPDISKANVSIAGDSFYLEDGIFGMALSPIRRDYDKVLFFHSLASVNENWVLTSVIRNSKLFEEHADSASSSFHQFKSERSSQAGAEAVDRNGILFFGLMTDLALACWNINTKYSQENIVKVVVDEETLQFAAGVKVRTTPYGRQEIWVLTSAFQRYFNGRLNPNETNFRIQSQFVDQLVYGTKCDVNHYHQWSPKFTY